MKKLTLAKEEWELGEQIGDAGGFGRVVAAISATGTPGAIKFIPNKPGADRELLFTGEGLNRVVPIIDEGEDGDQLVIAMPRAEKSLRKLLQESGGTLPVDECITVLVDIAAGLDELDANGIVHRDLKPENVLLLDGQWCLADFGIARFAEQATANHTWKMAGTDAYMAPERWKLERATIASDVYSLGIIAYELITGVVPFPGPYFGEQHLNDAPPELTGAPDRLATLVAECLYKAAGSRPDPETIVARLGKLQQVQLDGGLAALAGANRRNASLLAQADQGASQQETEERRRRELFGDAQAGLARISTSFLDQLAEAASTGQVMQAKTGWVFRIGEADLRMTDAVKADPIAWRGSAAPPFDVIAYTAMSLIVPQGTRGYRGRSHSLWFCDAKVEGRYRWFETAFMDNPMVATSRDIEPYAVAPAKDARAALGPGMHVLVPAWPFTELDTGDLDEFTSRWARWLADAMNGRPTHPMMMPERSPHGSWRTS
jgi:eukaryotic-like serine/threonine-protein kinase